MRGLDDTDRDIIRLLLEDARRPFSDIAEAVDLSPPAVSDRIDRLREMGVIRRFTVDLDRSRLQEGLHVFVTVQADPGAGATVASALGDLDGVGQIFRTADDRVTCTATVPGTEVGHLLAEHLDLEVVRDVDVRLLVGTEWSPQVGVAEFAPACVECGNTVDAEGESATLDDEVYYFCCGSCRDNFVARYEDLAEGA
ncbi:MAG: winged helix-turn-helix transcriptional regulator [Haloarculaceae archaeon]